MRFLVYIFMIGCATGLAGFSAYATEVMYRFDEQDPYSTAEKVDRQKEAECCYLRPPNLNGKDQANNKVETVKRGPRMQLPHHERRHEFKGVKVGGKIRTPRVKFQAPAYTMKKLDAELPMRFKDRPFDRDAADQY